VLFLSFQYTKYFLSMFILDRLFLIVCKLCLLYDYYVCQSSLKRHKPFQIKSSHFVYFCIKNPAVEYLSMRLLENGDQRHTNEGNYNVAPDM